MLRVARTVVEGSMLCSARLAFGDEVVAERLFDRDYDPGFVSRHTNQCAGLWTSYVEAQ